MPINLQHCLIVNTISINKEEEIINTNIKNSNIPIIIYGINCCDNTLNLKCSQLKSLGFTNVNVYVGGMFEWLLLQEVYGTDIFQTTSVELDILKYKPVSKCL
jgi:hypothetical protein